MYQPRLRHAAEVAVVESADPGHATTRLRLLRPPQRGPNRSPQRAGYSRCMALPPGPRQPAFMQLLQFTLRPLPFLEECLQRYGDPFTMRVAGLGTYVVLTAPELIKQVFRPSDSTSVRGA